MECARCGEEINPQEGLPVPTTRPDGSSGYLCSRCAEQERESRQTDSEREGE